MPEDSVVTGLCAKILKDIKSLLQATETHAMYFYHGQIRGMDIAVKELGFEPSIHVIPEAPNRPFIIDYAKLYEHVQDPANLIMGSDIIRILKEKNIITENAQYVEMQRSELDDLEMAKGFASAFNVDASDMGDTCAPGPDKQ